MLLLDSFPQLAWRPWNLVAQSCLLDGANLGSTTSQKGPLGKQIASQKLRQWLNFKHLSQEVEKPFLAETSQKNPDPGISQSMQKTAFHAISFCIR